MNKKIRCSSGKLSAGNRILSRFLLLFSIMVLFVASVSSVMGASLEVIPAELTVKNSATATWNSDNSANLVTTGSVGSGDEARIVIQASDVDVNTLNDLNTISWDVNVISGYLPHVDVFLDNGQTLIFEGAKSTAPDSVYCDVQPYPDGQITTFGVGRGEEINDNTYAWENGPIPGPCGDSAFELIHKSLADWKTFYGDVAVLRFEIEVDNWIPTLPNPEADIDNIKINGATYYGLIQGAIDAAVATDTINVAAGTYTESVLIDKSLTLVGVGGKPVITGASANYIIKVDTTNNVIIDNVEVNGGGSGTGDNAFDYGVWVSNADNVEIKNSVVKNIWKVSSNGIQVDDSINSDIHDNTISHFHKRGIRYVNSDGLLYDNEIFGESVNGVDRVQNLVNLWTGSDVEIYNNDLHNALTLIGSTPLWDSPAIFVSSYYTGYADSGSSYANIYGNEIYNGDSGIVVGSVYATTDSSSADITNNNMHDLNWAINFEQETVTATIHYNQFSNVNKAISAEGFDILENPPTVNAENNWWGTADGSIITTIVYENVDYSPFCTVSDCSATSNIIVGTGGFATIQAAVNAASDGDTIEVGAGTYAESLAINKGVTLQGAGRDFVTIIGTHTITANNVVIDGFTLDANTANFAVITIDDAAGIISGGTISDNKIFNSNLDGIRIGKSGSGNGVNQITIEDNEITANTRKGILFYNGGDYEAQAISDITISSNTITFSGSSGISTYGPGPNTITGNTVTDNTGNGISIKYDDGDVISGNTVTGNDAMGINMHQVTNTVVEDNIVSGHMSEDVVTTFWGDPIPVGKGSGIYVHEASISNTIQDNNIHDNKIGILVNKEVAGDNPSDNHINYNYILNNEVFGIQNVVPVTVDAEYNYFGAVNPDFDNIVSGDVDYRPWYIDSGMETLNEEVTECYPGDTETDTYGTNVGLCEYGIKTRNCKPDGTWEDTWTEIQAAIDPVLENQIAGNCGDTFDNDCDGYTDTEDTDCSITTDYYTKSELESGTEGSDGASLIGYYADWLTSTVKVALDTLYNFIMDLQDEDEDIWTEIYDEGEGIWSSIGDNEDAIEDNVDDIETLWTDLATEATSRQANESGQQVQIDSLETRAPQDTEGLDIYLTQGWNTFKLPWFVLVGTNQTDALDLGGNYSVENVLADIDGSYDYLAYYDGTDWRVYAPDEIEDDFTEFPSEAGTEDYTFYIYIDNADGARLTIDIEG